MAEKSDVGAIRTASVISRKGSSSIILRAVETNGIRQTEILVVVIR